MVVRARIISAIALLGALAACAPMYGPAPPSGLPSGGATGAEFRAADFAWSLAQGRNALVGVVAFKAGTTRYTCNGATVVLTPETAWSRRRMAVLYKSEQRAALPADEVRGRTAEAPPGDSGPYVKRAICDASDRFSFAGLPDGGWYVVTIAKPIPGAAGTNMALMRHVVTRGGKATNFDL